MTRGSGEMMPAEMIVMIMCCEAIAFFWRFTQIATPDRRQCAPVVMTYAP